MSATIRYGMVGGGADAFIGDVHRQSARLDGRYDLVCGAFSSDPKISLESGLALGLPEGRCYPDYLSMIEAEAGLPESERMQCVVIVTPNHLHFPVAKAAIQAGFHVISDKPATFDLAECRELSALLESSSCQYALTHPYTAYPMIQEARERIAAGELGKIRKIFVEYTQGWLAEAIETGGQKQADWRTDPQRAGISCCMGDIGVHAFNLAEFVSGLAVDSLSAELNRIVSGRCLDDDGAALLKFSNGASGVLIASQVCTGDENDLRLRIYGDKGGLSWSQEEPNSLWLKFSDQPTQLVRTGNPWTSKSSLNGVRLPAGHPEGYIEAFANIYKNFADHLLDSALDSKPAYPGIQDALRGMAFVETVVASSEQDNAWMDIPG